jgi:hypothetical protein
MEEQPYLGLKHEPERHEHYLTAWEEIKRRMQGAFEVLTGKSAAVDLERLSQLEFSHSIIEDDAVYSRERHLEKDIEPER